VASGAAARFAVVHLGGILVALRESYAEHKIGTSDDLQDADGVATRQLQVFPVCNGSCCNKCTIMARRVGLSPREVSSFFKAREKILFA